MLEYIGSSGDLSLFKSDEVGIVVDTSIDMVVNYGSILDITESNTWVADGREFSSAVTELALQIVSINQKSESLTAAATRMYTIPGGVQAEAKKALAWRKEEKRGGTPVGINTARTLAKGGQIGIEKIRHIAKYFPRHEVDKQGKGWKPGTSAFPSNGRIAWALWGGDAAWRWAEAIVERENKKAVTAGAYGFVDNHQEPNEFKIAHELDLNSGPEFLARVRHDGTGVDRLYKIEIDGNVYVWDDCAWDSLGHVDGDIYTYDAALDDVYDTCEKTHVIIDPSSAVIISAIMQKYPFESVPLEEINEEEAMLVADSLAQMDFELIERAMFAAAPVTPDGAINPNDNIDTPAEKSVRSKKQVRNAVGRFASVGQRIAVGGDMERGAGTIVSVDSENGLADVKLDSGKTITVGVQYTEPLQTQNTRGNAVRVSNNENAPLDMSGILGEPRTPVNQPKAHLPGTLPPMTDDELHTLMTNFPKYVQNMRESYKPSSAADKARVQKRWGVKKFADASIIAAGEEQGMTPETSDVKPKYLAIVLPEDPQAVMDLVAITPATATDPSPRTFKRKEGQWVLDEQMLRDLTSATPPDVIELDDDEYLKDIIKQVDGTKEITASAKLSLLWQEDLVSLVASLTAAGGLDRNRGNAEELRRYWTRGAGAAKIRWGTPGDWKRCVRHLGKYMGERAKGYCQLRHKDALGYYTSTHAKRDREASMEEVWGENIGEPTKITERELLMPLDDIMREQDDLYDSEWEPEDYICKQLSELANCEYSEFEALIAAGGLDRNRGNAEELRHYWVHGKGAAKIRWGTPGDWTRCVRNLSKYMGPRAKGYCQLRHKEATGIYTGDSKNPGNDFSAEAFDTAMIEAAALSARALEARSRFLGITASTEATGARFTIPLLIPENLESGDGRKFEPNAIEIRELPLPLMWQIKTGEGHNGSVVVGRIDYMERTEDGIGNAYGVFDTGPYGQEAERLVRNGFIRGVSADLDQFEAKEDKPEAPENAEGPEDVGKSKLTINHARVMAATIVAKPAFQECTISIDEGSPNTQEY